jgi:hypothetical protein
MLTQQQEQLLILLPDTEYGRALTAWLQQEIDLVEAAEPGKICHDPLLEDFRVQMGIKIGLKRVLQKPRELMQQINYRKETP